MGSRDDRCWCQKRQSAGQNWLGDSLESLRGGARLQGSKKLYGGGQIAAHLHPKEVFAVVEREVGALICGNVAYGGGESQGCKIKIVAPHRAVLRKGGGGGGRGEEPPAPASAGRQPNEASKMDYFF